MRSFSTSFTARALSIIVALLASYGAVTAGSGSANNVLFMQAAMAQGPEVHAKVRMLANVKAVQPGKPFMLGVELTMDPHWHSYYKDPGDAGMATSIKWQLPPGFSAGDLLWEKPTKFNEGGIVTYGYQDKTVIGALITPPSDLKPNAKVELSADVNWLTCKEVCLPGKGSASLTLPVAAAGVAAQPDNEDAFSKVNFNGSVKTIGSAGGPDTSSGSSQTGSTGVSQSNSSGTTSSDTGFDPLHEKLNLASGEQSQSLLAALGLAFVGGFILNFMPCVLPVIAIKILSFLQQAHDEPRRVRMLGITFAAGITSTFLLLGLIVLAVQAAGQQVGWGFQFQFPGFIIAMSVIVLLFALSLFGMFYVSVDPGTSQLNKLADKEGYAGTFFKGVLATVLSTPCTAPFLGTALGFAFTQSAASIVLIFLTIGLGMSLPYLVLSAKPEWMRFMPKPGVWMEKLKESFGFILLATVVWLLYVLGSEAGMEAVIWTSAFLVAVSFAAWIISRFTDLTSNTSRKAAVWSVASAVTLVSFYFFVAIRPGIGFIGDALLTKPMGGTVGTTNDGGIDWQPFTYPKLQDALKQRKTVLLDFTAQWCLTCKLNEQQVLSSKPVVEKLKSLNVVTMKADWTSQDATITELLHKFNRSGVPLYVIFPADKSKSPDVLPEVITQDMMLQHLDKAGPSA